MSILMESYGNSRLVLVQFLTEAAILLSLMVRWLLLPCCSWWPTSSSSSSSSSSSLEDSSTGDDEARARHRAAARAARQSLHLSTYGELAGEEEEAAAMTCAVCLSEVGRRDAVRELRNCGHVFHRGCLDRWLDHDERLSCPLCRAPLLSRLTAAASPPPSPSEPSWAVERLLYLFGDDLLAVPPP